MWERDLEWDDKLPEDLLKLWNQWCTELPEIRIITISRCYNAALKDVDTPVKREVHVFSDASESAYCAAVSFQNMLSVQ